MISQKATRHNKYVLFILLFSITLSWTGCSQINKKVDDNSTPEMLAQTLLYIVKTEDQELFNKHLLKPEEAIYMDTLTYYGNKHWYSEAMKNYMNYKTNIAQYEPHYRNFEGGKEAWLEQYHPDNVLKSLLIKEQEEYQNLSQNPFRLKERFREQGLSDWSNVEFDSFSFQFIRDGWVTNYNTVYFTNGDNHSGEITMPAFIKAPDGTWRFHNHPRYSEYY